MTILVLVEFNGTIHSSFRICIMILISKSEIGFKKIKKGVDNKWLSCYNPVFDSYITQQ